MTAVSSIDDPAEFLNHLLGQSSPDLLRELLEGFVNTILSAQADQVCGAPHGVRDEGRVNRRNGYRHRDLDTRLGTLDVAVPKLREGSFYPDWLLVRQRRSEQALVSVVATCYLLGVSTRRMDKLVKALGITGLSKSQVDPLRRPGRRHHGALPQPRHGRLAEPGPVRLRRRPRARGVQHHPGRPHRSTRRAGHRARSGVVRHQRPPPVRAGGGPGGRAVHGRRRAQVIR